MFLLMEDHNTIYAVVLPPKKSNLNLIKPLEVTPSYRDAARSYL